MTETKRKYKRTTQQDVDFVINNPKMKIKDISYLLGISLSSAYNLARRYRPERKTYHIFDEETTNRLIHLYNERFSYRNIAAFLNISLYSVMAKIASLRKKGLIEYKNWPFVRTDDNIKG